MSDDAEPIGTLDPERCDRWFERPWGDAPSQSNVTRCSIHSLGFVKRADDLDLPAGQVPHNRLAKLVMGGHTPDVGRG